MARLRPIRRQNSDSKASVAIRGHAFNQNLRDTHYETGVSTGCRRTTFRLAAAFKERRGYLMASTVDHRSCIPRDRTTQLSPRNYAPPMRGLDLAEEHALAEPATPRNDEQKYDKRQKHKSERQRGSSFNRRHAGKLMYPTRGEVHIGGHV